MCDIDAFDTELSRLISEKRIRSEMFSFLNTSNYEYSVPKYILLNIYKRLVFAIFRF